MAKEIEQALKDLRNSAVAWTARREAVLTFWRHHNSRLTCERYLTGAQE
jgi:hypothetical protein